MAFLRKQLLHTHTAFFIWSQDDARSMAAKSHPALCQCAGIQVIQCKPCVIHIWQDTIWIIGYLLHTPGNLYLVFCSYATSHLDTNTAPDGYQYWDYAELPTLVFYSLVIVAILRLPIILQKVREGKRCHSMQTLHKCSSLNCIGCVNTRITACDERCRCAGEHAVLLLEGKDHIRWEGQNRIGDNKWGYSRVQGLVLHGIYREGARKDDHSVWGTL